MHILNIAEKPSIAKAIAHNLSSTVQSSKSMYKYCPFYKFTDNICSKTVNFTFTAVTGHLVEYSLNEKQENLETGIYNRIYARMNNKVPEGDGLMQSITNLWATESPLALYDLPLTGKIREQGLVKNIRTKSDIVIIWTDNDREGEHIGREIADLIGEFDGFTKTFGILNSKKFDLKKYEIKENTNLREPKFRLSDVVKSPRHKIYRARFNSVTQEDIFFSLDNLTLLDLDQVSAVDTRIEMDLRSGFSITRILTVNLKNVNRDSNNKNVISYGQCQIPTLGFIVDRFLIHKNFTKELFYSLTLKIAVLFLQKNCNDCVKSETSKGEVNFNWQRKIFDRNCVISILEKIKKNISENKIKFEENKINKNIPKPLPLKTTTFVSLCVRMLNRGSDEIMKSAEELYTKGFISYPRSETDIYPSNFDFGKILKNFPNTVKLPTEVISYYKRKATQNCNLVCRDKCREYYKVKVNTPRKGKSNDNSHLPIYPIKPYTGDDPLCKSIADIVYNQFIASLHENGSDAVHKYEICIDGENFSAESTEIKKLGFREILGVQNLKDKIPFLVDLKSKNLINMENIDMTHKHTQPLPLLTEPCLIELMDKNGIGTDATIHDHIKKIQDRKYAIKVNKSFKPTNIGLNLVEGFGDVLRENKNLKYALHKPFLRSEFEKNVSEIAEGKEKKEVVLIKELRKYKEVSKILEENMEVLRIRFSENTIIDTNINNNRNTNYNNTIDTNTSYNNRNTNYNNTIDTNINNNNTNTNYNNTNYRTNYNTNKNRTNYKESIEISIENENFANPNLRKSNSNNRINSNINNTNKKSKTICEDEIDEIRKIIKMNPTSSIKCFCDFDTIRFVSNTEKNKNRIFLRCKKEYKKCDFFKWENES